ncbi:hypothetical protein ATL40_0990 [Serinibacter salmoneus]|uniref:Uncharacterized protein n=1 Tax=Serinibacter salmoneus TaxID=556530 RepID=A0A2A9D0R4_9MICO|nr:hypothetical protein ATL40_0990 [Serinibacter salmoneus]
MYNGVSYADGAGSMYGSGYNYVATSARVKDPVANSGAAYMHMRASKGNVHMQSRSANRTSRYWGYVAIGDLWFSAGSAGTYKTGKTCEDLAWRPDICSKSKSGY